MAAAKAGAEQAGRLHESHSLTGSVTISLLQAGSEKRGSVEEQVQEALRAAGMPGLGV